MATDVHQRSLASTPRMQVAAVAVAVLLQVQVVQMLSLAALADQAEVAPEVRRTVEDPLQEPQERATQVPVAVAVVIAMTQTHLLRVVLVVQALLLCATSCPPLQRPT